MTQYFGIDFSGARDAGRKIWLAALEHEAWRSLPRITSVTRASDLPDGGIRRDDALRGLHTFIVAQVSAVFGCDFPFSLAAPCIAQVTWLDFTRAFAQMYESPHALMLAGKQSGRELRRLTDRQTATPLAPTNLRLVGQTYHAIRDLLGPLAQSGHIQVPPLMPAVTASIPILIEVCPASFLKANGQYAPYKGRGEKLADARARLLNWLTASGVAIPDEIQAVAVRDTEGDALDSILAAVCAWLANLNSPLPEADAALMRLEGKVYGAQPLLPGPL
ncbi:MAG: DUF429 domain-containing protein [Pleurocapsa minor GSE-CHR-MK-17-07R]|jgi:hypothetical protein|nr:DUF429 domain-containing protein [Pleurocapsa minor GSE-CHR-MK 17-07R]